jgi:hypothetical protein
MTGLRKQNKIKCLRTLCEKKNILAHPEIEELSTTQLAKEIIRVRKLPK